jgi:hypothetical protein
MAPGSFSVVHQLPAPKLVVLESVGGLHCNSNGHARGPLEVIVGWNSWSLSNRLDALLLSHVPTALTRVLLLQSCNDIKSE